MLVHPTKSFRVERVASAEAFAAVLRDGHDGDREPVLPLWFREAEQARIAETISAELAALSPGESRRFDTVHVRTHAARDVVLAPANGPAQRLARRYAALTGRALVSAVSDVPAASADASDVTLTWFPALDETDMAERLYELRAALSTAMGWVPPIGVLTAEDASKLTWCVVKQVCSRPTGTTETSLLTHESPSARPPSSLTVLGPDRARRDVVAAFTGARGSLLINAHSRPHCGKLNVADGPLGVCGLPSGGRDGVCVGGTACHFGTAPRAELQDLRTERIFFNGCTTAGVGARASDGIPRAAMLTAAAMRSASREFIGNVRPGTYDDTDVDWLIGLSALGYTPAEAVEVFERARRATGRELIASGLYFGDPTNPPWPLAGAVVGAVAISNGTPAKVRVRWARVDRVLIAAIEGRAWAHAADTDRLHVAIDLPYPVTIVEDPRTDWSLVLVTPRACDTAAPPESLNLELTLLPRPFRRAVGSAGRRAVIHLRWLASLPALGEVVADAAAAVEQRILGLHAFAASRGDLGAYPELIDEATKEDERAACAFDERLIDAALARSRIYWNLANEYVHRVQAIPRGQSATCDVCGGFATEQLLVDLVETSVRRVERSCGICGIVSDLPEGALRPRVVTSSHRQENGSLIGHAEIVNDGTRPRRVTLGAVLEGAGPTTPDSREKATLTLGPHETAVFPFALTPAANTSGNFALRIFAASEGSLGMAAAFILFGKAS